MHGCPCPDYDCPNIPPTEGNAVLVLNTFKAENVPLVVDNFGNSREPKFEMLDETEAYRSCSVTFQNEMWMFGGFTEMRQVSKVVGCTLKRVADLTFDFHEGACTVGRNEVYLCFDNWQKNGKKCWKSQNPQGEYARIADTSYEHSEIRIAASNGEC